MERDDVRDELDRSLAQLAAATSDLAPDSRLTDAVMEAAQRADPAAEPLAGIARATRRLDADAAFADAVLARATLTEEAAPVASTGRPILRPGSEPARGGASSWLDGVVRTGPVAVGLAALAAAASFLLFLASQRDIDAALASSVDIVEVSE